MQGTATVCPFFLLRVMWPPLLHQHFVASFLMHFVSWEITPAISNKNGGAKSGGPDLLLGRMGVPKWDP